MCHTAGKITLVPALKEKGLVSHHTKQLEVEPWSLALLCQWCVCTINQFLHLTKRRQTTRLQLGPHLLTFSTRQRVHSTTATSRHTYHSNRLQKLQWTAGSFPIDFQLKRLAEMQSSTEQSSILLAGSATTQAHYFVLLCPVVEGWCVVYSQHLEKIRSSQ